MSVDPDNPLGAYLKDRRSRLDPAALGLPAGRRRTPGLRREEVAQRANVSATWYTWLEQGRGGAPSADVLDRLARALGLAPVEREHLFLLARRPPPQVREEPAATVTPRLQQVLDCLATPAYVQTFAWDIVAWNRAAVAVLGDYAAIPAEDRNILKFVFCDPGAPARMLNWATDARFVVAAFRADVTRGGASARAERLVEEIGAKSPAFAALWRDNDVAAHGEGAKHIQRPGVGELVLNYSAFAVEGQRGLSLVVYSPATPQDAERVATLVAAAGG